MMKKYLFLQSIVLFVCFMFLNSSFPYDTPQWHLPEGVKARIGKGRVMDIALAPDSTQLAVATRSGVWLYNARTGTEVAFLTGPGRPVDFVAYSPDGKTLAGASSRGIFLWDPHTQRKKKNFQTQGIPESIVYSPDGKTLAVGHWEGVDLLNAQTGERKLSLYTGDYVDLLAFSPDGNTLATANSHIRRGLRGSYLRSTPKDDSDKEIRLWDTRNGRSLQTLTGHADRVNAIAFSPDGRTLASGSSDTTLRLWDVKTGRFQQVFNYSRITSVTYSQDGKTLIITSGVNVNLWNVRTTQLQTTPMGNSNYITSTAFSSDRRVIAIHTRDGSLGFWDTQTGANWHSLTSHFDFLDIALSPNGNTLVSRMLYGLYFSDTLNGSFNQLLLNEGYNDVIAYSPDGNTLVIGGTRPNPQTGHLEVQIRWINARDGRWMRTLSGGFTSRINCLAFSPDGKTLAIGDRHGRILLWSENGGPLLTAHEESIISLAFSPDGKTLASSSVERIHLWNAKTKQLQQTLDATGSYALAYSPDGKTLASGSFEGIHLWNAKTGQLQQTLDYQSVRALAYLPDGSALISLEQDGEILLWDLDIPQSSEETTAQQPGGVAKMPDAKLAAAVRKTLGLEANAPITQQAMQKLTELKAPNSEIKDLTGLEHATQLTRLDLQENQISNLSPLAGLKKLWRLELWGNQIRDITPLAGLTNLTGLFISNNQVQDITPIADLTKLRGLDLGYNSPKIRDITPLVGLTQLEWLRLPGNQIRDITSLIRLAKLKEFMAWQNQIRDITPLAKLTKLEKLFLTDNDISDITGLSNLKLLEVLTLFGNRIQDISSLARLTRLKELKIGENPITDKAHSVY